MPSVSFSLQSAVFGAAAGNLSRTVFNPAALKKNNVINTGLPKRTKEEQKKVGGPPRPDRLFGLPWQSSLIGYSPRASIN